VPVGEGEAAGESGTVGMRPSRKREGKSVGESARHTVGMQPPPKGGGKPVRGTRGN